MQPSTTQQIHAGKQQQRKSHHGLQELFIYWCESFTSSAFGDVYLLCPMQLPHRNKAQIPATNTSEFANNEAWP